MLISSYKNKTKRYLRSLAQGIDGYLKKKEDNDVMNLYKNVKFLANSNAVYLNSIANKDQNEADKKKVSSVGRKVFKKAE